MSFNPKEIRNAQWAEVLLHVGSDLTRVHEAWAKHGPCTTRQLAERSGISLLTLRPRTTDLFQIGLVACDGRQGREGIYRFVSHDCAAADWQAREAPIQTAPAPVSSSQRREAGTRPAAVHETAASAAGRELRRARDRKARLGGFRGRQLDMFATGGSA